MTVLGLTGPTGAGKGAVGELLAQRGARIIDTDRLAREVVEPGSECLAQLAACFGQDILRGDGSLDRAALAKKAFSSPIRKKELEAITHPAIIARSRDILSHSTAALAVIDAPLLFESGMDSLCDVTLAVVAPAPIRLERIMRRDGIDEAAAALRMNAQPAEEFYRSRADHTLTNDGDLEALRAALEAVIGRMGVVL